jgi:hypothetical protein
MLIPTQRVLQISKNDYLTNTISDCFLAYLTTLYQLNSLQSKININFIHLIFRPYLTGDNLSPL